MSAKELNIFVIVAIIITFLFFIIFCNFNCIVFIKDLQILKKYKFLFFTHFLFLVSTKARMAGNVFLKSFRSDFSIKNENEKSVDDEKQNSTFEGCFRATRMVNISL